MHINIKDCRRAIFRTVAMSILLTFSTLQITPPFLSVARAQMAIPELPAPGAMLNLSLPLRPPILRGLTIHAENPFRFDFIVDRGETRLKGNELKNEYEKLIKYFLATLTIPEEDLWVNLSPYEKDRIIPHEFGLTEMGRDLLGQDYILKQLTASLTYPEEGLGKKFWDEVYRKTYEQFGVTDIPLNTLNKVWIVPDKAVVYENDDKAFIMESHLKVMLEEDYLALQNSLKNKKLDAGPLDEGQMQAINGVISRVTREILIPAIEKEVNEGQNFARLRQIYHSMILAAWYKKTLKDNLLNQIYSNQKKIAGVDANDPAVKEKIYQQYLEVFQKGVYNYIKEDYDLKTKETIPRKYFSGGFEGRGLTQTIQGIREISPGAMTALANIEKKNGFDRIEGFNVPTDSAPEIREKLEARSSSPLTDPQTVRKSLQAYEYQDQAQNFSGVDLEHFVHAQTRLAERKLSPQVLAQLMRQLGVNPNLPSTEAYPEIYKQLSTGKYTKGIVDLINASSEGQSTYADPRLNVTIVGQNPNPRAQGINEAVANSVDAILERLGLGDLKIGQFGMGVKQIIDWLEASGQDRIDVVTREVNSPQGLWHHLTILKDTAGQLYIQINTIESAKEFETFFGFPPVTTQGTVARIKTRASIPRTEADLDERHRNSQQAMAEGIHRRFAYLSNSVNITTQIGDIPRKKVNGTGGKEVIVGTALPTAAQKGDIHVAFTDHAITVIDNGVGMDQEIIGRMFVPKEGTKDVEPLSEAERMEERDTKVKVIHDPSLAHRVSFARNGEVIKAVDIPSDILERAAVSGGVMLEFGRLVEVPESRDEIRIPVDLKPGEVSNFQLAMAYMIHGIIENTTLSSEEIVQYVNTVIVGLEQLQKGNANYEAVIEMIRTQAKEALAPVINRLQAEGVVILPHDQQFEKLAVGQGRRVLFVNEHLFNWQGALSLKELGGEIIPGITVAGEKRLPLVVVPFTAESLASVSRFRTQWHSLSEEKRLPVIQTDRFIAVPPELGQRLNELATKRIYGELTAEEQQEFSQLAELINIVTGAETTTAYEVTHVPAQLNIASREEIEQSTGPDAKAVNRFNQFINNPPIARQVGASQMSRVPADANQQYVLMQDGGLIEVNTGKKVLEHIHALKPLGHDYYLTEGPQIIGWGGRYTKLVRLQSGLEPEAIYSVHSLSGGIVMSPDNKFAYVKGRGSWENVKEIFDLETGSRFPLEDFREPSSHNDNASSPISFSPASSPRERKRMNLQFSHDGKYLTYEESEQDLSNQLVIVNLQEKRVVKKIKTFYSPIMDIKPVLNPFANVVYMPYYMKKNEVVLKLVDLTSGQLIAGNAKHLYTDSTGAYTVIIKPNDEMEIYVHKAKKLITSQDPILKGRKISEVRSMYRMDRAFFEIIAAGFAYRFDENGEIEFNARVSLNDFYQYITSDGALGYNLNQTTHLAGKFYLNELDSLQLLDGKAVYKRPQFNLIIDHSDPGYPVAIDPKTGSRYEFSGELLYWLPDEGGNIFYVHEGQLVQNHGAGTMITEGKVFAMDKGIDEGGAPRVRVVVTAPEDPNLFYLIEYVSGRQLGRRIPGITSTEYGAVSFDSKYFVFTNPQTGDVAYLNPEQPDQPILVGKEISAQPSATTAATAFLDTKPADAPQQVTIVENSDGSYSLRGAGKSEDENRIVRVNPDVVIAYGRGLMAYPDPGRSPEEVVHLYVNGEQLFEFAGLIITYTDKLLVGEKQSGEKRVQFVIDFDRLKRGTLQAKYYPGLENSKKVALSASGRFSIHETFDGKLVYYDHNEAHPTAKVILEDLTNEEYLVHDKADVVILKDPDGRYSAYGLEEGVLLATSADHIEVDSSGQFIIEKAASDALHLKLNLVKNRWVMDPRNVKIASDADSFYLLESELSHYYQFNNKSGSLVYEGPPNSDYPLPRFWEQYDLEKKTIWDRVENRNVVEKLSDDEFSQLYRTRQPTRPYIKLNRADSDTYESFSLFGSTLTHLQEGRGNAINIVVRNLETGGWPDVGVARLRGRKEDKKISIDSLYGQKVWYVMSIEKGLVNHAEVAISGSVGESFDEVWVNQDKTYMLGYRWGSRGFFLIDHEGHMEEITVEIPVGFVPVDINGVYFVFNNPQTGEIKYFDPRRAGMVVGKPQTTTGTVVEDSPAYQRWQSEVVPKGQGWVSQAQGVYNPVFELIENEYPEYQGEINREISPLLDRLYLAQQKEIQARFEKTLKEDHPADQTPSLPFDRFQERMTRLLSHLTRFLNDPAVKAAAAKEEYNLQRNFYVNLFTSIFDLGNKFDIDLDRMSQLAAEAGLNEEAIYQDLLDMLAHGFKINSSQQLNLVPALGQLTNQLREVTRNTIKMEDLKKIMIFFAKASGRDADSVAIVDNQIKKILRLKPRAREKFLTQMRQAFAAAELETLLKSVAHPDINDELGDARSFVVFLTHDVEQVRDETEEEKQNFIPAGEGIDLPSDGIPLASITEEEARRAKSGGEIDEIMSLDYLLEHRHRLPPPSTKTQTDLMRDIKVQRESGAYTAEITQNARDAGAGHLEVTYYLHTTENNQKEFVEEASDDGSGALEEVALLIRKSTKAAGGQMGTTGYFGTGKFTIFEGVDRVEMISNNGHQAYMFVVTVLKDAAGNPVDIRLLRVRKITDPNLKKGVTIRRVKAIENTIPELDQMLSQRSWKVFAGLAQAEQFKINFVDYDGQVRRHQPLLVEHETLAEDDFKAIKIGDTSPAAETNFGKVRVIAAKDMPLQILDRVGLRVKEIDEKYLALVPAALRRHIRELGINIQIPLPLIRGRSGFEHEEEYLSVIQKYVAIALFKAIAYKTLTQVDPQFVFNGFPIDWETNDDYWHSIGLNDQSVVSLAEKINQGQYHSITNLEIESLLPQREGGDFEKKIVKLILMLKIPTKSGFTSLLLRRLAVQQELDRQRQQQRTRAAQQIDSLRQLGLDVNSQDIPSIREIYNYRERIAQAGNNETASEQMRHLEDFLIDPNDYTQKEKRLVQFGLLTAKLVGLEQVLLVSDEVLFGGAFVSYQGKKTMLLNQAVALKLGTARSEMAIMDEGTNVFDHELAHLLEHLITESIGQEGFVAHAANFTHDRVGTFADAMKYMASLWLANLGGVATDIPDIPSIEPGPSDSDAPEVSSPISQKDVLEQATFENPGGIDFNPQKLNLQTQGPGVEMDLPFDPQNFDKIPINGLTPVIFQITPVINLPLFLGLAEDHSEILSSIR